ncbi:hypothetical protein FRB99_000258 [Tulasnella sp. 403]|nr:hypothetical protein FRB99_000258 [Tulasnella sp. 403]
MKIHQHCEALHRRNHHCQCTFEVYPPVEAKPIALLKAPRLNCNFPTKNWPHLSQIETLQRRNSNREISSVKPPTEPFIPYTKAQSTPYSLPGSRLCDSKIKLNDTPPDAPPSYYHQRPHDLLEVPLNAPPQILRKAYHRKALLLHPDKGGSIEEFKALTRAFEALLQNSKTPINVNVHVNVTNTKTGHTESPKSQIPKNTNEDTSQRCHHCGKHNNAKKCQRILGLCFNCGTKGHHFRNCPMPSRRSTTQ